MSTSLVKFGEYTPEAAEQEAAQLSSGSYFKLEVGNNIVRFLPPKQGQSSPFISLSQHFVKVPGGGRAVTFACPRVMLRQPCLVCARAEQLQQSPHQADKKAAKDLFPGHRTFCNLISRKEPDKGPQTFGCGKTIHRWLAGLRTPAAGAAFAVDFTHPIEGRDIRIKRTGTGMEDTRYECTSASNATLLHPDAATMQSWIDEQPDLRAIARVPSMGEVLGMFGVATESEAADVMSGSQPSGDSGGSQPKGRTVEDATDAEFT